MCNTKVTYMLKTVFIFLFCFCSTFFCFSGSTIDSLKAVLAKQIKEDTIRLKTLNTLGLKLKSDEPEEALTYLFEAERLALKIKDEKFLTRTYNVLGICYKGLGDLDSALFYYEKSLVIAIKIKDSTSCGFLYSNMGNVYKNRGMYEKAVQYFQKAADIHELKKNISGLSSTYNNIGLVYDDMNQNKKAMEYYEMSLKYARSENDSESISRSYNNISIVLDKMGDSKKGLKYKLLAIDIDRKIGNQRSLSIGLVNLGAYYYDNGNVKEGLKYYNQALKIKEEIGDDKGLANLMNNIGNAYLDLGDRGKALTCFQKALSLSSENAYIEIESDANKYLSDFYKESDYKLAYTYFVRHKQLEDSIYNADNNKIIKEMQSKYESDKKEQQIALLNKDKALQEVDLQKQKTIRNYFIGFGVLVLALFVVMIVAYRYKRKANTLLSKQKAEIVLQRNEIQHQKHVVEEKHKEITDSINYAERIQKSFLANLELLNSNFDDYFLFFKPKDVVSGDFYWAAKLNNGNFALVTADSTGHGVPGAIMSLLNITSLEKAVEKYVEPSDILNDARKNIIERLKKDGSVEGGKDGMDASICVYDFKNKKLTIASANNPVWIMRTVSSSAVENQYEIIEVKPDKMPVGKHDKQDVSFSQQEIELKTGDVVYTLTDGYPDQFGGDKGKKFMSKSLRELLATNAHLPMNEQKIILQNTFTNWVGNNEQVDDVTVIGVRV